MKITLSILVAMAMIASPLLAAQKGSPVKKARHAQADDDAPMSGSVGTNGDQKSIRELRPIAIVASGVGKTPFLGLQADVNVLPYVALGAGYGYFSSGSVSGSFLPVFLQLYPLTGNFSPFLEGGADFITVKFQSANTLLNSTFQGTQLVLGAGAEYRFDFGLVTRIDVVRFMNARVWSPGAQIGYSFVVNP